MRNARGNARWWTTGVSLRGWSLELGPIGSQCLEDRPGTPSRGLISTHLVRRPIGSLHRSGSFLHREHTLRRVLMRNGISGAFIVSFRFFFLSLFLFPLPLANFSPLSRWVYPSSWFTVYVDTRKWVRSVLGRSRWIVEWFMLMEKFHSFMEWNVKLMDVITIALILKSIEY